MPQNNTRQIFAETALLSNGWANNVLMAWDEKGILTSITEGAAPQETVNKASGPVMPSMHNLHSHAFQRAMAGLSERREKGRESFWSWREIMYGFLAKITPEDVESIAAMLYLECLKYGYGSVGEFHYLHHSIGGGHYDSIEEHSLRILSAAKNTGIALTHLPVLYAYAGFEQAPLSDAQGRFRTDPDMIMQIVEATTKAAKSSSHAHNVKVGVAPHSLRAVSIPMLQEMTNALHSFDATAPVHIHIAEQMKEVNDCLAVTTKRPVELLMDNLDVDERWCLIHATHLSATETTSIATSKSIAGICPTTEGNLGDGLFPMVDFLNQQGRYGIGSDSHVSRSPVEELRLLEYGQRLHHQQRAVIADQNSPSVGRKLWSDTAVGGAQALNINSGSLQVGKRADFLTLDHNHENLYGRHGDYLLDSFLFNGNENLVKDNYVAGVRIIENGTHIKEEEIKSNFRKTLDKLLS